MARPLEDRLPAEREKMRGSEQALRDRTDKFARGPRSKQILEKTLTYESNGHNSYAFFQSPPVIERGNGAILIDVDGNEYIDLHAGFTVAALGHNNEEVNAAIVEQLGNFTQFAELPMAIRAELARIISERHPGDFSTKIFWAVTGGEAVEIAMKMTRWYTGKPIILTHWGDYHGRTAGAMALTGISASMAYHYPIPPLDTAVIRVPFAYCYRCPYDKTYPECELYCADQVEELFETNRTWLNNPKAKITNVAAMIIEPFQSSAGYIIPPLGYLRRLKEISEKYDFLFVSDEVQSGMGRTGKLWAIEHAEVAPDLITMGKSISNGLPISAVTGRKEILDSWGPGAHASTFSASPPACAGGVKVFEIFDRDNVLERVAELGEHFLNGLQDLSEKHPSIGHYDGLGLYLGIELVKDRESKEPAAEAAGWAMNKLLESGVICLYSGYYGNRLMFAPPLVIKKHEIDEALAILDKVLGNMEAKFGIPA